jgi:hypothetical protein
VENNFEEVNDSYNKNSSQQDNNEYKHAVFEMNAKAAFSSEKPIRVNKTFIQFMVMVVVGGFFAFVFMNSGVERVELAKYDSPARMNFEALKLSVVAPSGFQLNTERGEGLFQRGSDKSMLFCRTRPSKEIKHSKYVKFSCVFYGQNLQNEFGGKVVESKPGTLGRYPAALVVMERKGGEWEKIVAWGVRRDSMLQEAIFIYKSKDKVLSEKEMYKTFGSLKTYYPKRNNPDRINPSGNKTKALPKEEEQSNGFKKWDLSKMENLN